MTDETNIPGPHEVTHEQWQSMTPEERAVAGDASRYPTTNEVTINAELVDMAGGEV